MIVAETLDTPWTQFYDQVSAAMDKTYQLDDAVLGYLDTQLQKRLQQVRTQMLLLVAALAVVLQRSYTSTAVSTFPPAPP